MTLDNQRLELNQELTRATHSIIITFMLTNRKCMYFSKMLLCKYHVLSESKLDSAKCKEEMASDADTLSRKA